MRWVVLAPPLIALLLTGPGCSSDEALVESRHVVTAGDLTADVVVPVVNPCQPETLHAVYSKRCLPAIESRLTANRLRIIGFFEEVSVHYVERQKIAKFDPEFHSFVNMNTSSEWQAVRALAGKLDAG